MIGIGSNLKYQPNVMAQVTGAALEYYFAERETDAPFGRNPIALTNTTVAGTCTRFNDQGVLETLTSRPSPRKDYDPATLAYQNNLLQSADLSQSPWTQNIGGFWTSSRSSEIANPEGKNQHVTKFVRTSTAATEGLFTRQTGLSMTAGQRAFSIHIFIPAGQGVTDWKFIADWQDAESGQSGTNTAIGSWVRVSATVTVAATRSFIDGSLIINGSTVPPAGFYFYACWAQENAGALLPYKHAITTPIAKYACRGNLFEPAATNSIRNNTMVGAVAGSPGTLPTNWTLSLASGLSQQVVGVGTESGHGYIDLRISGTTAASGQINLGFEAGAVVSATTGQIWAHSVPVKLAAGSLANTSFRVTVDQMNGSGSYVTGGPETVITPTNAGINTQRYSTITAAIANASTAYVRPVLYSSVASGVAIDVTLRIGMPQLERDRVTSIIPTAGSAVTRAADVPPYALLGSLLAGGEYTLAIKARAAANGETGIWRWPVAVQPASGTGANAAGFFFDDPGTDKIVGIVRSGGGDVADLTTTVTVQPNTSFRAALRVRANDFAAAANGGAVATDALGAVPAGVDRLMVGSGDSLWFGWLEYIGVHTRSAANAEISQMSA